MMEGVTTRGYLKASFQSIISSVRLAITSVTMRFSVLFVFAVLGYAAARPQIPVHLPVPVDGPFKIVPTLKREEIRDDAGQYSSFFQSADGGAQSSYGVLKPNLDGPGHFLAVTGSYSYTAPDGTPVYVSYVADEKGFRILDTKPVVPETPTVTA